MTITKKTLNEAKNYVEITIKAGLTPYIVGSPGLGKSAMVKAIAKKYSLKLIDIRLAQEDPTGINGFPKIDNGRSTYLPPSIFPLETDPVPEGYVGWLIFLDELPSAPRATLAAAYKIILDRMIGEHKLHKNCVMIAAGNTMDDNAIVNDIGSAMKSRMIHIHVTTNADEYLDFATKNNFDSRLIAYLAYQKHKVNTFEEFNNHSLDETFACERTWEFVSKLLAHIEPDQTKPIPYEYTNLLVGTVGSSAIEFVAFTQAFEKIPPLDRILKEPTEVFIPTESSTKYLVMTMLVNNATKENIDVIMDYINRYSKEYSLIFIKMLWSRDNSFLENKKVEKLFVEIGNLLLNDI